MKMLELDSAEGARTEFVAGQDRAGRPPSRPVCATCTGMARSTVRSTVASKRSTDAVDWLKGTTLS